MPRKDNKYHSVTTFFQLKINIKQYISNFFFCCLWLISGSVFFNIATLLTHSSVRTTLHLARAQERSQKSIIHSAVWMLIPNFALCGLSIADLAFVIQTFLIAKLILPLLLLRLPLPLMPLLLIQEQNNIVWCKLHVSISCRS